MPNQVSKALYPGWEVQRQLYSRGPGAVYEIARGEERSLLTVLSVPLPRRDPWAGSARREGESAAIIPFPAELQSNVEEFARIRGLNGQANVLRCEETRFIQKDDGLGWDVFIRTELLEPVTSSLRSGLTERRVLRLAADVCRALSAAESCGLVHGDLCPENIYTAGEESFKLGGFGQAGLLEKAGGDKSGRLAFMAPERWRGESAGPAADVCSLGLVLYWLLNEGCTPFLAPPPAPAGEAEREKAALRRLGGEPVPAPTHGSEDLKRVVLRACAHDPGSRYPDAGAMLRDLEALLRGEPLPSAAPSRAPGKKGKGLIAAGAALVVTAAVLIMLRPVAMNNVQGLINGFTIDNSDRPSPAAAAITPGAAATLPPMPAPTPEPMPELMPALMPEPTSEPTPEPTPESTPESTPEPTSEPTPEPTLEPTPEPTSEPTPEPIPVTTPVPGETEAPVQTEEDVLGIWYLTEIRDLNYQPKAVFRSSGVTETIQIQADGTGLIAVVESYGAGEEPSSFPCSFEDGLLRLGDRELRLQDGKLQEEGSATRVYSREKPEPLIADPAPARKPSDFEGSWILKLYGTGRTFAAAEELGFSAEARMSDGELRMVRTHKQVSVPYTFVFDEMLVNGELRGEEGGESLTLSLRQDGTILLTVGRDRQQWLLQRVVASTSS